MATEPAADTPIAPLVVPQDAAWTLAVETWNAAHAVVECYRAVPGGISDELMDHATTVEHDAAYRLVATSAPDRAGVGIKINALLDYLEGCKTDIPTLRTIAADALRGEA
jgi:hypothetical protein